MQAPYPDRDIASIATVLSAAALLAAGLLGFVFPRVVAQWEHDGTALPVYAQFMVRSGDFLNHYGVFVYPVLLIILALSARLWRRSRLEARTHD